MQMYQEHSLPKVVPLLYNITIYLYKKIRMNIKEAIDNYLGKRTNFSDRDLGDGTKEVCDLDTGVCYIVRERDGLIERVQNNTYVNKQVMVETGNGIKTLLNG